jgi:hypothetical protein
MVRTTLIVVAALLAAVTVQAAEFSQNPHPTQPATGSPLGPDAPNITQSADPVSIVAGSVACSDSGTGTTTENHYLRRFFLNADHSIVGGYSVTSVDYGVESATVLTTGVPLNVSVYEIANGDALTFGNLTSLGSASTTIPDGTSLQAFNQPVTGFVDDPVGKDLVIDIWTPDGTVGPDFALFIGSNDAGESQPSYLAAADCGITEPATTASIGYPNMHIVMTVNGDEITGPTPTPPPVGAPVPSMNRYGIMVMIGLLIGVAILAMWRRS